MFPHLLFTLLSLKAGNNDLVEKSNNGAPPAQADNSSNQTLIRKLQSFPDDSSEQSPLVYPSSEIKDLRTGTRSHTHINGAAFF